MKYLTIDVLEGSKLQDQEWRNKAKLEFEKARKHRDQLLADANQDMETLRLRLQAMLTRLETEMHPVFEEDLEAMIKKRNENSRFPETLGLSKHSLRHADNEIVSKRDNLALLEGPSSLTRFLETVEEDHITNYGLKSAGFPNVLAGRLVVKARDARG